MSEEKKITEEIKTQKTEPEELKSGMTVRVHEKIKDIDAKGKERTRIQVFEGIILSVRKPKTVNGSILVRKTSHNNIGVEKIFPLKSPLIDKIEAVKEIKTRRAKLYFLPDYKKRLKIKKNSK
ncbi:MAG TPA: 50S ribosomal protein L19 [bacterium]|nr:50S ribosomal protein L19 [bacterium]